MSEFTNRATCNLSSISDMILNYTTEALIILWGILVVFLIVGIVWVGQKIWEDVIETLYPYLAWPFNMTKYYIEKLFGR